MCWKESAKEIPGSDPAQPVDILALQETTSNGTTVAPIVDGLNAYYNAPGMYAMSTYQGTESGGDVANGNGPNALVYNITTVQLYCFSGSRHTGKLVERGISAGGAIRVCAGGMPPTPANEFYVYVSHYKSSSSGVEATNEIYRNEEAAHHPQR